MPVRSWANVQERASPLVAVPKGETGGPTDADAGDVLAGGCL
jgi:hypothetical protein